MYSNEYDAAIAATIIDPPAGVYEGTTMAITPVNHVGGVSICCPLPQEKLLRTIPGLAPQQFTAVSVRIGHPEVTFLLFDGGNVRVTGAKSMSAFFLGIHQLRNFLAFHGYQARVANVSLDNIVGRCAIGHTLKVEAIETAILQNNSPLQGTGIYEPDLFSALIYRIRLSNCKITITVFESGKIMVLGITNMEKASVAVKRFQEFALAFKHDTTDTSQQKDKSKKRSHQRAFEKKNREEKDDEDEFIADIVEEDDDEDKEEDQISDSDDEEQIDLEKKRKKAGRLTFDEIEEIQLEAQEQFSDLSDEQLMAKIKEMGRAKSQKKMLAFDKRHEKKNQKEPIKK